MAFLLDTNIAIHLRDLDNVVTRLVAALPARPLMSIVTSLQLENGVVRVPAWKLFRRMRVDALNDELPVLEFGPAELAEYRRIVEAVGYSRPRILDRMIAATALVHRLTVITMNGADFSDVPGLTLEVWESPAA